MPSRLERGATQATLRCPSNAVLPKPHCATVQLYPSNTVPPKHHRAPYNCTQATLWYNCTGVAHRVAGVGVQRGPHNVHQVVRHLLAVHKQVGLEEPVAARERVLGGGGVCEESGRRRGLRARLATMRRSVWRVGFVGTARGRAPAQATLTCRLDLRPSLPKSCLPRRPPSRVLSVDMACWLTGCAPSWTVQCQTAPHWWGRASARPGTWWCSNPGPTRRTPGPSPAVGSSS